MTPNEFQLLCTRTDADSAEHHQKIAQRFHYNARVNTKDSSISLAHAVLGISTESGELADAYKKFLIYGKSLDFENINEECGDLLWYICLALKAIGVSLEDCMEHNVEKLKIRYPEKFTEELAKERLDKK